MDAAETPAPLAGPFAALDLQIHLGGEGHGRARSQGPGLAALLAGMEIDGPSFQGEVHRHAVGAVPVHEGQVQDFGAVQDVRHQGGIVLHAFAHGVSFGLANQPGDAYLLPSEKGTAAASLFPPGNSAAGENESA
jgi:hypothetical protein